MNWLSRFERNFGQNSQCVAVASCDQQESKLRTVAGAEGFWVAELRVRQVKIGQKSCFDIYYCLYNFYTAPACNCLLGFEICGEGTIVCNNNRFSFCLSVFFSVPPKFRGLCHYFNSYCALISFKNFFGNLWAAFGQSLGNLFACSWQA